MTDRILSHDPTLIRRPSQERGRIRYEAILDCAERMLMELDPSEISIHMIATEASIPPASIYHFFPDAHLIFVGLAERYLSGMALAPLLPKSVESIDSWQAFQDWKFQQFRKWFNANKPGCKLLLSGPMLSREIQALDLAYSYFFAERAIETLRKLFIVPDIPHLVDRSVEVLEINKSIWALSIHRYGSITDEMDEQARRARIAYSRTYLPEYLELRPTG